MRIRVSTLLVVLAVAHSLWADESCEPGWCTTGAPLNRVETMICSDGVLGALDVLMQEVFEATVVGSGPADRISEQNEWRSNERDTVHDRTLLAEIFFDRIDTISEEPAAPVRRRGRCRPSWCDSESLTPVESAICDDPRLQAADAALQRIYDRLEELLRDRALTRLRWDQNNWRHRVRDRVSPREPEELLAVVVARAWDLHDRIVDLTGS